MKILYWILLLMSVQVHATTYYVANKGNDNNSGTSSQNAWRTIAKLNAATFLPGDEILFKKGDVWNERLNPPSSGVEGKVIRFGSYGQGVKPVITGLRTLSEFTNEGNIWTTTATASVPNLNTVLIDGSIRAKARYPNTGYLTFTSYNNKNQITGALSGTPDYTGAELVVRSTHWIIDVSKIVSQSGGTLNFSPDLSYVPNIGGNGYFIQNNLLALDTLGEWVFDATTKKLAVYSKQKPAVQISTIDTLVFVHNKKYITLDGLNIQGANAAAVLLHTTNNITIRNCSINYSGRWAIAGVLSSYVSIVSDSIQNSLSNAIYFVTSDFKKPGSDYAVVDGNYIKNSGTMAGMGLEQYIRYCGIFISGTQSTITNNRIDNTGYEAIMFCGRKSLVKNNYITNFCFVKDDGGGIYTGIGKYYPADYNDGSIIRANIVVNGLGALAGTLPSNNFAAPGIYVDDDSRLITVDSNTVLNCVFSAINLNRVNAVTVRENTLVNKDGTGLAIHGTNEFGNNMNIRKNIIISKSTQQVSIFRNYGTSVSGLDSNYYSSYNKKNEKGNFNLSGTFYNLSTWNATTGQDLHSISIPIDSALSSPQLFYNFNKKDSVIKLNGIYYDVKGKPFKNTLTLHPFQSVVLFKTNPRKNSSVQ